MKNNIKNILMLSTVCLITGTTNAMAVCSPTDCIKFGYTKTEPECSGQETIRCPFDVTKIQCLKTCAVGDIYYSDLSCSPNIVAGKTPIGVVGYTENGGTSGLVVALDETQKSWSSENYDLPCITNLWDTTQLNTSFEGKSNTACIVQTKNSRGATYDAGMYCANYNSGGVNGWFLPATGEIYQSMFKERDSINTTLGKLNMTKLDNTGTSSYYSSTEHTCSYCPPVNPEKVWFVSTTNGRMGSNGNGKRYSGPVRCMLEF